MLINDTTLRSTIVDKELLVINQDGLPFLDIAHETAVKVRMQIVLLKEFKGLLLVTVRMIVLRIILPYRGDSHYLNRLRS